MARACKPNKYSVEDSICRIECFRLSGELAGTIIIDTSDVDLVKQYKWHIENSRKGLQYAQASYNGGTIRLHRLLLPASDQVDHINHNGLDNRRENLRACNNSENNRNKDFQRSPESGHTGVRLNKKNGRYYARIMVDKKEISLGGYATLDEAINARKQAEIQYFGSYKFNK